MAIVYKQYMPTPTASQTITSNGTYNVVDKASAVVNVPSWNPVMSHNVIQSKTIFSVGMPTMQTHIIATGSYGIASLPTMESYEQIV